METLAYFMAQLFTMMLGGLFIRLAIGDYQEKRYFSFGVEIFVAANFMFTLAYTHLVYWEVL